MTTTDQAALEARLAAQRARQADRTPSSGRSAGAVAQRWLRDLHVWTSMLALLVILFFGVTGLLLNHPSWLGGDEVVTTNHEGTLPTSVRGEGGDIEFLAVSIFLRDAHDLGGEVTNFDQIGTEGSINYTGPGYGASVRFDVETLDYTVVERGEGFVNAMRDLHTGSDSGTAWGLVIDVAAVFLIVVSVTGIGIQLLMRKRRNLALVLAAAGTVATVAGGWLALP